MINGGVRYPYMKIDQLHFGRGTPTETVVSRDTPAAKPIIAAEIAALVRHELMGVVENGTGDNQLEIFGVGYEIGSKW